MSLDQVYVMPASPAQLGMWMNVQQDPGSAAYNVPATMRLTGPLDPEALRRAFAAVSPSPAAT